MVRQQFGLRVKSEQPSILELLYALDSRSPEIKCWYIDFIYCLNLPRNISKHILLGTRVSCGYLSSVEEHTKDICNFISIL